MEDFLPKLGLLLGCQPKLLEGSRLFNIGGRHFIHPYPMEVIELHIAGFQVEHVMDQLQTEDESDQIKKESERKKLTSSIIG